MFWTPWSDFGRILALANAEHYGIPWYCACARLCTVLEFFYKLVNASLNKNCCSQHDYYHLFMTYVDRVFFIFYSYWFTKVTPGAHKHEFNQNWMMFRVIMFQISILHVGEYTAYNSGESIKNWVSITFWG